MIETVEQDKIEEKKIGIGMPKVGQCAMRERMRTFESYQLWRRAPDKMKCKRKLFRKFLN